MRTASLVVAASARNIQSDSCAASATAVACLVSPVSLITRRKTTTVPASASGGASSGLPATANAATTTAATAATTSAGIVAGLDQELSDLTSLKTLGVPQRPLKTEAMSGADASSASATSSATWVPRPATWPEVRSATASASPIVTAR